jgi:hypothetical protein
MVGLLSPASPALRLRRFVELLAFHRDARSAVLCLLAWGRPADIPRLISEPPINPINRRARRTLANIGKEAFEILPLLANRDAGSVNRRPKLDPLRH